MSYLRFLKALEVLGIGVLKVTNNPDTWALSEKYGPDTWLLISGDIYVVGLYTQRGRKGILVYDSSEKRDLIKETAVEHGVSYRFPDIISRSSNTVVVNRDGEFYEEPLQQFSREQMNFEAPIPQGQGFYELLIADPAPGSVKKIVPLNSELKNIPIQFILWSNGDA